MNTAVQTIKYILVDSVQDICGTSLIGPISVLKCFLPCILPASLDGLPNLITDLHSLLRRRGAVHGLDDRRHVFEVEPVDLGRRDDDGGDNDVLRDIGQRLGSILVREKVDVDARDASEVTGRDCVHRLLRLVGGVGAEECVEAGVRDLGQTVGLNAFLKTEVEDG